MVYDYKYRVLGEQDVATFSYSDSFYLLEKGSLYIPHNIYKSATIVFNEKGLRMRFFWRILYWYIFWCSVGSFFPLTGAPKSSVRGFRSSWSRCSGSSGQPMVAKLDPEPEEEHFTLNATVIFQDRVFVSNRSNIDVWSYHIPQLEKNSCSPLTTGIILFLKSINWWISFLIFQKKKLRHR